ADRANDQAANHHRWNAAFAPEKARSTDDGRGNRKSLKTLSSCWLRCPQARGGQNAGEARTDSRDHKNNQRMQFDIDPRKIGRLTISPQRVNVASEPRFCGYEP